MKINLNIYITRSNEFIRKISHNSLSPELFTSKIYGTVWNITVKNMQNPRQCIFNPPQEILHEKTKLKSSIYIRKVKRSLCFTDFLFCTILRDRLERKREKERKIKRKEKNCTEEDAGTVCKYRNVSFLVSTFRLPASSRPDGLSLSSCIPVTIIIRWGCQKGKKRGKGG